MKAFIHLWYCLLSMHAYQNKKKGIKPVCDMQMKRARCPPDAQDQEASTDINQYQSSFHGKPCNANGSYHTRNGARQHSNDTDTNVDLSDCSGPASSGSIVEESGDTDSDSGSVSGSGSGSGSGSQSGSDTEWSGSGSEVRCRSRPHSPDKAVDSLTPFEDSSQLPGATHAFNNPLTFAPLRGGDDDTPTAQFVPDRPADLKPRPPQPPPSMQPGLRPPHADHTDPQYEKFWTFGEAAGQPGQAQAGMHAPRHTPHVAGGLPVINEVHVTPLFPYNNGSGSMHMGMPAVLGEVEVCCCLFFFGFGPPPCNLDGVFSQLLKRAGADSYSVRRIVVD
jgi:hypothetical protein